MKKILHLFIVVFTFVLLTNCEREDIYVNTQDNIFSELEANFDEQAFLKTVPFDFEADWFSAQKHYSEELKAEYFEISIEDLGITPKKIKENRPIYQIDYKIIAIENEGDSFSYYVVKFYQKLNNDNSLTPASSISFADTESFTGLINVIDNEGDMVFAKRLTDGILNDNKLFAQKEFKKPSFLKRVEEDCTTVTIEVWEDWYNIGSDGTMYYHHSTFKGYEYRESCETYWLPDLNISGGGGAGIYVNRSGVAGVYRACGGPHCQYEIEDVIVENNFLNLIDNHDPSCKSFNYTDVGTANWQCAAVENIWSTFSVFDWNELAFKETLVVFSQSLYFQLPKSIPSGLAAEKSAAALREAFILFDSYYVDHHNDSVLSLEIKLKEYIVAEMNKLGGTVTLTPPLGFNGGETSYRERSIWNNDDCY